MVSALMVYDFEMVLWVLRILCKESYEIAQKAQRYIRLVILLCDIVVYIMKWVKDPHSDFEYLINAIDLWTTFIGEKA